MTVDLSTRYLGFELGNPVAVGASPLTDRTDALRRLEAEGASAAVLPSLFEEQVVHEEEQVHGVLEFGAESFPEALDYFPELDTYNTGPQQYLRAIERAKRAVEIPVFASLNGATKGGWVRFARLIEQAGADALELNLHFVPTDPAQSAADVEARYVDIVASVRSDVKIPLAVKIGPYFSAPAHFATRLAEAGAGALVLFNRLLPPDIDPEVLAVVPRPHLSVPEDIKLRLQWIAILRDRVRLDLAATGGAHAAEGVLKLLLAGADLVMVVSTLFLHGEGKVGEILGAVEGWMEENGYRSVEQMKGSMSHANCPDPTAYERANYMRSLVTLARGHV